MREIYIVAVKWKSCNMERGGKELRRTFQFSIIQKSTTTQKFVFLEHSRHFFMNENNDNPGKRRWKKRRRMRKSLLKGRSKRCS